MDKSEHNYDLDRLFFKADNDIKDGLIAEAFDTLSYIIEQDLEYGKAYNHLGWIYETKYKNFGKAEECYKLALKYSPEYTAIYINYAILLSTLEKFDELNPILERALKVPGINKSKIWNEYGIMYELQARYQDAVEAYKKGIQTSLVDEDIDRFQKSITRCRKKQEQFSSIN
jgi:tetratricopeptide (TPR) repeat protein